MEDRSFRDFAELLLDRGGNDRVVVEEYLDHPYAVGHGKAVALEHPPLEPFVVPQMVRVGTLSGLVGFLMSNVDGLDISKLLITCSAADVTLDGPLEGPRKNRPCYAIAQYLSDDMPSSLLDLRTFRIQLRRCFEPNDELERLLADTSKVATKSADLREEGEEGLGWRTQDVRERVSTQDSVVTNPVYVLRPYRTFPEAGQQEQVPFLCQLTGGEDEKTKAVLVDCGGSQWVAAAAQRVGETVLSLLVDAGAEVSVIW